MVDGLSDEGLGNVVVHTRVGKKSSVRLCLCSKLTSDVFYKGTFVLWVTVKEH